MRAVGVRDARMFAQLQATVELEEEHKRKARRVERLQGKLARLLRQRDQLKFSDAQPDEAALWPPSPASQGEREAAQSPTRASELVAAEGAAAAADARLAQARTTASRAQATLQQASDGLRQLAGTLKVGAPPAGTHSSLARSLALSLARSAPCIAP